MFYCSQLCSIVLNYIQLFSIVFYCSQLCYIVLNCVLLFSIVFYCFKGMKIQGSRNLNGTRWARTRGARTRGARIHSTKSKYRLFLTSCTQLHKFMINDDKHNIIRHCYSWNRLPCNHHQFSIIVTCYRPPVTTVSSYHLIQPRKQQPQKKLSTPLAAIHYSI